MKRMIVVLLAVVMFGCAGMTVQQQADMGIVIANMALVTAQSYYDANAAKFSPEDAAAFQMYLQGFKMAIETGVGMNGYVQRWYEFLDE